MTAPVRSGVLLARAALAYVTELRWRVFPLQGKVPFAGTAGCLDASNTPETVRRWWQRTPDANIGIATGAGSGIVVIDLDGPEAEVAFTERFGNPPTPSSLTHRGRHLVFQHPGGLVPNSAGKLGPKIDVRGDGGYIVAPPSIHPDSGQPYAWDLANGMHPRYLPPAPMPSVLRAALLESKPETSARTIAALTMIPDGERNNTLARLAGRLLARGHDLEETFALVVGVNQRIARPPLPELEVRAIVTSIAKREAKKPSRTTPTGRTLSVDAPLEPETRDDRDAADATEMAAVQISSAIERGRRDVSGDPRWDFGDLDALVGPIMPGSLWVVGALPSNGKTAMLFSQMAAMAEYGLPVVYLPLEMDPDDLRRKWAAWQLGLDQELVGLNQWDKLPSGSQGRHEAELERQRSAPVHFPPDRRVTVSGVAKWMRWGVETVGSRLIVIDHFHRMDLSGQQNYRIAVNDAIRSLKDLAREHQVAVVASAQLNGDPDPFDRYMPPQLRRLKESSALAEEADVVMMLSRVLQKLTSKEDIEAVRRGWKSVRDLALPNVMQVTCRKHRHADSRAGDRSVRLAVTNGRVRNLARSWQQDGA